MDISLESILHPLQALREQARARQQDLDERIADALIARRKALADEVQHSLPDLDQGTYVKLHERFKAFAEREACWRTFRSYRKILWLFKRDGTDAALQELQAQFAQFLDTSSLAAEHDARIQGYRDRLALLDEESARLDASIALLQDAITRGISLPPETAQALIALLPKKVIDPRKPTAFELSEARRLEDDDEEDDSILDLLKDMDRVHSGIRNDIRGFAPAASAAIGAIGTFAGGGASVSWADDGESTASPVAPGRTAASPLECTPADTPGSDLAAWATSIVTGNSTIASASTETDTLTAADAEATSFTVAPAEIATDDSLGAFS